ncbi:hypothetical protein QJS04_geneDACA016787 [Acorus gramineus]|uniref:Methyltransferase type 11 domain-containing protein n=1 Tax=Acorus gramineus TaxID=55184 RepID=A0AAV9BIJ9_ACOGR|nr:hypothetical protein QJS04_geneDACA016787 [Acorus gramineus]
MGIIEGSPSRKSSSSSSLETSPSKSMLKVLLLIVCTNILTVFLLSSPSHSSLNLFSSLSTPTPNLTTTTSLLHDLNSTLHLLSAAQSQISSLSRRLKVSNSLSESLLVELGRFNLANNNNPSEPDPNSGWRDELFGELKLAVGPHDLPLGHSPNIGSDKLYPQLGHACLHHQEDLIQYMTYDIGGGCPSDELFAQRLMLKGCEPLPRRRCHPKSPKGFIDPAPHPENLWSIPPDTSVVWDAYTCKNYSCLVNRARAPGSYDCKDCFDIRAGARERARWLRDDGALDYGIDEVLRAAGTVRVGLDIGGGTGTFAARMKERGVTIVTSTMNFDGPFGPFIASRGLIAMQLSVAHRLPFFENTLDIVHSMHVLSNWIPDVVLEFALFDIYRVLRPGGVFWVDHFFCVGGQLNETYVPMFGRIGFRKLRWNEGRKLDRGIEKDEWYLSALLEKPRT